MVAVPAPLVTEPNPHAEGGSAVNLATKKSSKYAESASTITSAGLDSSSSTSGFQVSTLSTSSFQVPTLSLPGCTGAQVSSNLQEIARTENIIVVKATHVSRLERFPEDCLTLAHLC